MGPSRTSPSTLATGRLAPMLLAALLLVLAWAPLPLGSNRPWSEALLALAIGAILVAWGLGRLAGRLPQGLDLRHLALPALPFAAAWLWALVQTLPGLPAGWHHPAWAEAAAALGESLDGRIALDPLRARDSLFVLALAAAVFFLATQLCRERLPALVLAGGIGVLAALHALLGLIAHLWGIELLPWIHHARDQVVAGFINRNHFATFAGIGMLACWAMLLRRLMVALEGDGDPARRRLRRLLEGLLKDGWLYLALALICGMAVLLTRSRAGMLAAGMGLGVLLLALLLRRPAGWTARLAVAAPVLLAAGLVVAASGGHTWTRLADEMVLKGNDRLMAYSLALDDIAARPWLGIGWGGYQAAFRLRRTEDFEFGRDELENEYLQHAMELGLPAAALFLAAPGVLALAAARGVRRRRRDQVLPALGLAVSALVAVHAAFDFSLRIPAVLLVYAAVMGMAYAQSFNTRAR